ncbi:MAG: sigma-70 family RNA polymerase sigma factor [Lachnospiraceae bacterium]|nr:sigma-70 family RNA polymerase sigma factor [Lachnospiraceae bacterium]
MLKIARNLALKRFDYNHADKRDVFLSIPLEELEDCIPSHISRFGPSELEDCINTFLEQLAPLDRKIFLLRYWYFSSIKEIAVELSDWGISKSCIETKLFRMRQKLKQYIIERKIHI